MRGLRVGLAVGLAAVVAVAAVAVAQPRNGGFETRDFSGGWKTVGVDGFSGAPAPSQWEVYGSADRGGASTVDFTPPQGLFAAGVHQEDRPGLDILHRKLRLAKGKINKLSFFLAWENIAANFHSPRSFRCRRAKGPSRAGARNRNQQFRIDILKANAPIRSLRRKHVLTTLVKTTNRTRDKRGFRKQTFNLTREGVRKRRVQLRVATCVNLAPLAVAIDQVKQRTKRR